MQDNVEVLDKVAEQINMKINTKTEDNYKKDNKKTGII